MATKKERTERPASTIWWEPYQLEKRKGVSGFGGAGVLRKGLQDKTDDEEAQRLREGVDQVTPHGDAVGSSHWCIESMRINLPAVLLASEGVDGADCASSLAGHL
jgi:hypothetical protein